MKSQTDKVYAYVPISLGNLTDMLNGTSLCPERMHLFFHQLFISRLKQADSGSGTWLFEQNWVAIDSRILKAVLTDHYIKYINYAEAEGLIQRRRDGLTHGIKYFAGKDCQLMKINPALLHKPGTIRHFRKEPITKLKPLKAVGNAKNLYQKKRVKSDWYSLVNATHLKIVEMTRLIRFDLLAADSFLTKKYSRARTEKRKKRIINYLHSIEAINDGSFEYYKVDTYGNRLHTQITGLYSPLRNYIYFENMPEEPLVQIDVRNCQIYLVSCMIVHPEVINKLLPEFITCIPILAKYQYCPDVEVFYKKCCDGIIYDDIAGALHPIKDSTSKQLEANRNKVKKGILAFLYSNPNNKTEDSRPSELSIYFQNTYPNVLNAVSEIKSLDILPFMTDFYVDKKGKYANASYKNISRMCQLFESRMILGRIAPSLIQCHLSPFTTIHDALLLLKTHEGIAVEIIETEFRNLGVNPPILKTTY
jgi:hypothetical protein